LLFDQIATLAQIKSLSIVSGDNGASNSFSFILLDMYRAFLICTVLLLFIKCKNSNSTPPNLLLEPYDFITNSGDTIPAQLGSFKVTENRKAQIEKEIELSFVLFPSTNPNPDFPIVYLAGGPGGSGINAARGSRSDLFMALRQIADVIAFDQRATGLSSPFEYEECEINLPRPTETPLSHQKLIDLSLKAANECAEFWRSNGVDIDAYNTFESAADIEDLRKALGVKKLNLWGISYGTHLGLSFLKYYPESVGKSILAGIEGPDHTVKLPIYSEHQLDQLNQLILDNEKLRKQYPDLKNTIIRTLKELEQNPVTIEYQDPETKVKETVVVGRPELERLSISLLRDPSTMVTLPSLYDRINSNDYLALADSPNLDFEMEAMEESMDAASGMSIKRKNLFIKQDKNTILGGGNQLGNASMAKALSIQDLGSEFRSPIQTKNPVLFISGTLDGRTPIGNALEVSKGFENASFLTIKNGGHSNDLLISSPEIESSINDFLNGDQIKKTITIQPPSFDDIKVPVSLSDEIVQKYLGTYSDGKERTWTVIPKGTYTVRDRNGKTTQRNSIIQVRIEPNGYTLEALNENTFFVEIPGWQNITFVFKINPKTDEMELSYNVKGIAKTVVKKIM